MILVTGANGLAGSAVIREFARQQLFVKEKALTRARDALAAERRWMPWLAAEKKYEFDSADTRP